MNNLKAGFFDLSFEFLARQHRNSGFTRPSSQFPVGYMKGTYLVARKDDPFFHNSGKLSQDSLPLRSLMTVLKEAHGKDEVETLFLKRKSSYCVSHNSGKPDWYFIPLHSSFDHMKVQVATH